MKRHYFVMDGDTIAATMDGSGSNFEKLITTFESAGYITKEVTAKEYKNEKQRQEKMMWDRDEEILCANCGGREVLETGDYCDLCEEE